jgi:CheY-like chemotaxis protein
MIDGATYPHDASAPIEVLLVEDDPGDVQLTKEAFEEHKVRNRLTVVSDGVDALAYLRRDPAVYPDAVRPDLILLDLNLPRVDGREVLSEIKGDPELRSTSRSPWTSTGSSRWCARSTSSS